MNVLVTGASGQLGSEMRVAVGGCADNYIFTDIADLDITSQEEVDRAMRVLKVDVVVNCAAYTAVDMAEDEPLQAERINHHAVANLAKLCAKHDATLIHIATDYIFDGTTDMPYTEESSASPLSVYGRSKLAGEATIAESGCRAIIIRTSWLYSEFGSNFVKTMRSLTTSKQSLKVVNDQIGTPTYASDLASVLVKIIERRMLDRCGVYNFSGEGECSWYEFAVEIARQSGNNHCTIEPCTSEEYSTKAVRPRYSVLDKNKIKATFGIEIEDWKIALGRCIDKLNATR